MYPETFLILACKLNRPIRTNYGPTLPLYSTYHLHVTKSCSPRDVCSTLLQITFHRGNEPIIIHHLFVILQLHDQLQNSSAKPNGAVGD